MSVVIGALRVSLGMDSAAFQNGLKRSQSSMVAFGKKMAVVGAGIAAAGVAAFSGFERAVNSLGDLKKQAGIAGLSADKFKIAALAVEQYGVSQEQLSDILKDVNEKFGDFAATGGGELKDFFDNIAPKVGLTIDSFKNLSSSDALALYVTALQDANVSQQEMTFYMEALANDATALVPAFQNGGQAIKDMTARAAELGLSIDENLIANAKKVQSDYRLISEIVGIQLQQAFLQLTPLISEVMTKWVPAAISFGQAIGGLPQKANEAGLALNQWLRDAGAALAQLPQSAISAVGDFAAALAGGMANVAQQAVAWATRIVAQVATGLAGIGQAAVDAIGIFGASLSAGMASLATSAAEWGRNIVQGLVDGITSFEDRIEAAVGRMSGKVMGFADDMKIRSPSRVFMQYGRFITEGLAIGIDQGAKAATDAMHDVAAGLSGVFRGMLLEGESFGDSMRSMLSNVFSGWSGKLWDQAWSGLTAAVGIPSFAGGGYTWDGPRSGGLDGHGGRLAMLHPRETVIDHTRRGATGAMNLTIDLRGTTGDDGLDAKMRAAGERILAQAKSQAPGWVADHDKRNG